MLTRFLLNYLFLKHCDQDVYRAGSCLLPSVAFGVFFLLTFVEICKYSFLPLWGFFLRFIFGHVCLYFTIDGREVGRKQEERARGGGGGGYIWCIHSATKVLPLPLCLCIQSCFKVSFHLALFMHFTVHPNSQYTDCTLYAQSVWLISVLTKISSLSSFLDVYSWT